MSDAVGLQPPERLFTKPEARPGGLLERYSSSPSQARHMPMQLNPGAGQNHAGNGLHEGASRQLGLLQTAHGMPKAGGPHEPGQGELPLLPPPPPLRLGVDFGTCIAMCPSCAHRSTRPLMPTHTHTAFYLVELCIFHGAL